MAKKLKTYQFNDIKDEIEARIANVPLNLTDYMIDDSIKEAIRELDKRVADTRGMIFQSPGTKIDLVNTDVEEINCIYTSSSSEFFNVLLPEVGLLSFVMNNGAGGSSSSFSLSNISDYLIYKTSLNIMTRLMGLGKDYEHYRYGDEDYILMNKNYPWVYLEYLPHFDTEATQWNLYQAELSYLKDRAYYLINLRSSESLYAGSPLGVYADAKNLIDMWTDKIEKLDKEFQEQGIIVGIQ